MSKFLLLLSFLTAVRAFTLMDKNNLEFASNQLDTSSDSDRMLAEKTNEIRKGLKNTKNSRKYEIQSETPTENGNLHYSEPHETEKKQRNRQRKGRKPRPLTLLKSPEYCRRTKLCKTKTVPLSQRISEEPDLAKRLQPWIKIYGPPAEDVIVIQ